MKLRSLLLAPFAALAISTAAPAQEVLVAPQTTAEPARPAMWKLADHDTTIYLFGTFHLLPDGIAWYNGPVAEAFERSDELVTELPETPENQSAAMFLKYGALPTGQSLRAMMNESERASYEAAMAQLGLPAGVFDRYKPWLAAMALATLPLQQDGYSQFSGVENQLDTRNKALGRKRHGLETLDEQLSIFGRFPMEMQKRYLFEVVGALPTLREDVRKMVVAWSSGDAATLATLINAEEEDPAMYKALLTDRNKAWAKWLTARMEQPGTVFVAVGAGHLGGKDSVQDELAKAGHKTERVQ
jgi:uncharacterized protein YbaP (TraB family)